MALPASQSGPADDAFDPDYYLMANDDVRAFGFDPTDHYIRFGKAEGRAANASQAAGRILNLDGERAPRPRQQQQQAPVVSAANRPAVAVLADPAASGASDPSKALAVLAEFDDTVESGPPGWFDPIFYRQQNRDVVVRNQDPFDHYTHSGMREGRAPNRVIGRNVPGKSIAVHHHMAGERAAITASGLLDVGWYSETYQVRPERAIAHYVWKGAFLGTNPSLFFSSLDYIKANVDILVVGVNPFAHYISYGFREGRGGVKTLSETRLTASVWVKGL